MTRCSDEDDGGEIFQFVTDFEISQDAEVSRENAAIHMRPDTIIGLSMTDQYRKYTTSGPSDLTHCPVIGSPLLYPFLLFEAKREDNASGFRSIEAQTAFPLYRLLSLQDRLRRQSKSKFEPLVWFFGYQGEVWHLYAAVMECPSVVSFACYAFYKSCYLSSSLARF